MKNILTISFIIISSRCLSQGIVPITYGPLVSMTSTSLSATPGFVDQVAGAGYNIGAMVRLKVLFLYAQAEASYGSKSASVTEIDTGANSNVTYKLKGMDFTALIGMKLIGIKDIGNVRIFGGYNWSNFSDISYSIDGDIFAASNVNNNNHSLLLGFGIDLSKFSFDLKFINGFVDLAKSENEDVQSRVINLTVAYRFR